jgi:hypothetical protein
MGRVVASLLARHRVARAAGRGVLGGQWMLATAFAVALGVGAPLHVGHAESHSDDGPAVSEADRSADDAAENADGDARNTAEGEAGVAPNAAAEASAAESRPLPPHAPDWGPLEFLGDVIPPGESRRLRFESLDSFTAGLVAMRGVAPGPTVCVTAGVHGDELNGIAIARRLIDETDPAALAGTLVVVPIVNAYGFRNGSRYLPDRRDLNRYFPGSPRGSAASRIAHQFFQQVMRGCDSLVDLHTGSLNRANMPQIRTDLSAIDNLRLSWGFAIEHVIHSIGQPGPLRRAANELLAISSSAASPSLAGGGAFSGRSWPRSGRPLFPRRRPLPRCVRRRTPRARG